MKLAFLKICVVTLAVLAVGCAGKMRLNTSVNEPKETVEELQARYDATDDPKEKEIIGVAIDKLLKKEEKERKEALKDLDTPSMEEAREEIEKRDKKELERARTNDRSRGRSSLTCPYPEDEKLVWVSENVTSRYREDQAATFKISNNLDVPVEIHTLTGAYPHHNSVPVVRNLCPHGFIVIRQRSLTYYDSRAVQYLAIIREEGKPVRTEQSPVIHLQTSGGGFYDYGYQVPPVDWVIGGSRSESSYFGASSAGSGTSSTSGPVQSGVGSILGAFRSGTNRTGR